MRNTEQRLEMGLGKVKSEGHKTMEILDIKTGMQGSARSQSSSMAKPKGHGFSTGWEMVG